MIDRQTFADESFKIDDPQGLVVLAQLPQWVELRWHADLVKRIGPDLKWRRVERHWDGLGPDLQKAILRDLREALITIVDSSIYRSDLEESVAEAIGQSADGWPREFRAWFDRTADRYEAESILIDSPVLSIQNFLEDDGYTLGGFGGIEDNYDKDRSLFSDLQQKLGKPHNMRLFGARSAAAFSPLLNPDDRRRALEELWDERYIVPGQIVAHLLAEGDTTQHVFDEGNRPSVSAIADLYDSTRRRLEVRGQYVLSADTPRRAIELESGGTPLLQAADLAAGRARGIYLARGVKGVSEEFKGVILNGSMIRAGR